MRWSQITIAVCRDFDNVVLSERRAEGANSMQHLNFSVPAFLLRHLIARHSSFLSLQHTLPFSLSSFASPLSLAAADQLRLTHSYCRWAAKRVSHLREVGRRQKRWVGLRHGRFMLRLFLENVPCTLLSPLLLRCCHSPLLNLKD